MASLLSQSGCGECHCQPLGLLKGLKVRNGPTGLSFVLSFSRPNSFSFGLTLVFPFVQSSVEEMRSIDALLKSLCAAAFPRCPSVHFSHLLQKELEESRRDGLEPTLL
jgi:hypothetical protein